MLHTKFRGNQTIVSEKEDFRRVFTIYGCGSHLGHVIQMSQTKISMPLSMEASHEIWL